MEPNKVSGKLKVMKNWIVKFLFGYNRVLNDIY